MIANRFAEDAVSLGGDGEEPRPGSARRLQVTAATGLSRAESLSNRVSFFIDDAVVRADSARDLRDRRLVVATAKVSRHHSDVSATRRPTGKLQRRRSARGGRPLARHESLEPQHYHHQHQRSASVRRPHSPAAPAATPPVVQLPRKDLPPKERRRRIAVLVVFITCLFIVTCSVLAVIITLTHESFHSAPPGQNRSADVDVRKQNEQHQNSLSRDEGASSGLFNASSNSVPPGNNTAQAYAL